MGKPTKNAFGGRRLRDISQPDSTSTRPKGGMTPEGYQAMKAEKRQKFPERQRAKVLAKSPRRRQGEREVASKKSPHKKGFLRKRKAERKERQTANQRARDARDQALKGKHHGR